MINSRCSLFSVEGVYSPVGAIPSFKSDWGDSIEKQPSNSPLSIWCQQMAPNKGHSLKPVLLPSAPQLCPPF